MSTPNFIGDTLWYALALPATNNAAGFEALTWVEALGHQTLPQFGISHSMIDVADLKSGFTKASKGAATGTDTSVEFRQIAADASQAALRTAGEDQNGIISLRIVKGSGAANAPATGDPAQYAQGILHSYQPKQGSDSESEGFSVSFRQNDFTVVDDIPA